MGRTREDKEHIVERLKTTLSQSQLGLVIEYQGLSVAEMTDLRRRMQPSGTQCRMAKNTLMELAVREDPQWQPMRKFLKGASIFLLVQEDMKGAIKAYQEFQRVSKKTELRGGVFSGQALTPDDVKALTELPSREELMGRIAGALVAVPTRLAVGLHAVPTQLAVGVQEVPGSLVRAIRAVSEREPAAS